ncbi:MULTISPECIES: hypothetical protein [unclassified Gordonia (in: high G+C Gram-positive bacteria)]|uniref:hypothetical protein n=1 Tax=unclassified Gordonia (in: high G+C Gram-positive bacteria) TaxID=2657482 RepID=UPI001F0E5205|nr:hypothetical protein [Gordonia sp. ABSL49_1]MCH5642235.1 hypothetical protein [Gordonia sp. ABSL49_1]
MTFQPPPPGGRAGPPPGPRSHPVGPPTGGFPGLSGPGPLQPPTTGPAGQYGPAATPYGPPGPPGPGQFGPGPGYSPPGPGRPPNGGGNGGTIAAIVCGVIAVLAIAGLVVTLIVKSNSSGDDTPAAASTTQTTSDTTTTDSPYSTYSTPDSTTPPSGGDPTEVAAIQVAMQNYVTAGNARDLTRMKAAVCSQNRSQVTLPSKPGNIIIESLLATQIDGDFAQTRMLVHVEEGTRRTASEPANARLLKENNQWLYCPGAEPSIGT